MIAFLTYQGGSFSSHFICRIDEHNSEEEDGEEEEEGDPLLKVHNELNYFLDLSFD